MEIDAEESMDEKEYESCRMQYKLPPKKDEWSVHFRIDSKHEVNAVVCYDGDAEVDDIHIAKINAVFKMTKSVPITLSYVCKLFDGRYLREKVKRLKQANSSNVVEPDNDENMIDID